MNTNLAKIDIWTRPATVEPNNFKYKSLSNWSFNISVGCTHGCRFCYVPDTSTLKQSIPLKEFGVKDPDKEWGQYSLLRDWDADKFYASLEKAKGTRAADLKVDGNRAIMYCTTTDPYQVFKATSAARTKELMGRAEQLVRNSLEIIRDSSDLNVRILTRSPLAEKHFDLFKRFGNRLLFGMSLPTLSDKLCRIYEPNAPGPQARLRALRNARKAGLNVFVAMAPTYPECDEEDLRATLAAIKELKPVTVFHEPINIRAKNVARIQEAGEAAGVALKSEVFADQVSWYGYAVKQLLEVQRLAVDLKMHHCLHLWPDQTLKNRDCFMSMRNKVWEADGLSEAASLRRGEQNRVTYEELYLPWLESWWSRISEWPGKPRKKDWKFPSMLDLFSHKVCATLV